ncbi:hypothetical protein Tco_0816684 [Tanacetum coccineum]
MMNRTTMERMKLESIENGPLIWPSIKENGVTRPKKYSELSATEVIQADCDIKATNIILQDYHLKSMHWKGNLRVLQGLILWEQVETILENKERLFATTAKGKATCPNSATNQRGKGMIRGLRINLHEEELTFLADPGIPEGQATQTIITHNAAY